MNRRVSLIVIAAIIVLVVGFFYSRLPSQDSKVADVNVTPSSVPNIEEATQSATISAANKEMPVAATTSPSGLQIVDIKEGTGPGVKSGDIVIIHYSGTLANGSKFDSSYDRNQPFETQIGVGRVIKGWDEGIIGLKVGGKRILTIPPELGYGAAGAGPKIPPNSTLIFQVELLQIK